MKVVGEGNVHFYEPSDEGAHPYSNDPWWNESVWLQWGEHASGLHGAIRIGHQPNFQGGHTSIWSKVGTPDWIYKRDGLYPMQESDKVKNGFGANGTHRAYWDDKGGHWSIEDEDISVELTTKDYHPPIGYTPGKWMENIAKNHLESAGTISGTIKIKDKTYTVKEGLFGRDHSWGVRYWLHMRVHRYTQATFGPDLSVNAICFYDEVDRLHQWGYVVRGDEIIPAKEVDVIAYMEADGVSNRGGHLTMNLTTGEKLDFEFEGVVPSAISFHYAIACTDTICNVH
ncbi:MAG: hypothetical protein ABWZ40_14230, partial [Caulobacterales bacterium]